MTENDTHLRDVRMSFRHAQPEDIKPLSPSYGAEAQAVQRAIIRLFDHWSLSDTDASILLGDLSARTYQRWKSGQYGRVGIDLSTRMSNLLGIHKALRLLFSDASRGYHWIKAPNTAFGGRSALDIMRDGQITDLMRIRRYLDAQRGQW